MLGFCSDELYNPLLDMGRHLLLVVGLLTTFSLGCASEPEARQDQPAQRQARGTRPTGKWATGRVSGDDQAMGMEMSVGVLDEREVDRAIKPHERALSSCFLHAGDARKYLSGQIVMRFVVTASGQVSDVQVVKNAVGNYFVESCLIGQGKQIRFPAPEGRRGTDFEYSMSFLSTGERTVIPWSGEEMARHMNSISADLANCGALGAADVDVIAYVEPGGTVGSVGFASQESLDPAAASCAVSLMRKVRITDAPVGHSSIVLRATFPLAMALERPLGESASSATHKLSRHTRQHRQ